jgi:hypothetical protein
LLVSLDFEYHYQNFKDAMNSNVFSVGRRCLTLLCLNFASSLHADERLFGFTYEADLLPKGALEYEQGMTNYNGQAEGVFSRWQITQELEYGFSDRLSGSFYLNYNDVYSSLNTPSGTQSAEAFSFDGVSTEWKYQCLSPFKDSFGLVLYLEPRYSGTELEIEPKLILQKNLGESLVLALNLTPETEYSFTADGQSMHGEEFLSAAASWKAGPIAAGLEVLNHRWLPNWGPETASAWFAGPALHVAQDKWWATLSLLPQLQGQPSTIPGDGRYLGSDDYAKVISRLILGLEF